MNTKRVIKIDKKYTHFALSLLTGKIVDGWDYKGYDMDDIKPFYKMDMKDNDRDLKQHKLVDALSLFKKGINPYDGLNWGNN